MEITTDSFFPKTNLKHDKIGTSSLTQHNPNFVKDTRTTSHYIAHAKMKTSAHL
jgi:hypothetical protein